MQNTQKIENRKFLYEKELHPPTPQFPFGNLVTYHTVPYEIVPSC